MEVRWSVRNTKDWQKCRISIYQIGNLNDFFFTFGFVRSSERVVRAVIDMEYVASDNLGNLVRIRIVRVVHFTYANRC